MTVAFTRHICSCRTTAFTARTAIATTTLSLRVCLCFLAQSLSQDDGGEHLPQCPLPQAVRHGQALCHLSRHISRRCPPRASSCGQARATSTSNRSQACLPSRAGSNKTPLVEGVLCLFLSHTPITRRADYASIRRGAGRSRRTHSWSGRSARRAGQEEARLLNLARHV